MLLVEDLKVKVGGKVLLTHIDLEIKPGEVHALLGPNGSGKTSLLMTLIGYPEYEVVDGRIVLNGVDITHAPIDERARLGMGMLYQHPPAIKGLKTRDMINICAGSRELDVEELGRKVNMDSFLERDVNANLSGGEIKRSELFQLMAQNPDLMLFDEPESGVDLQNINLVGETIAELLQRRVEPGNAKTVRENKAARTKMGLIITHTGHILDYLAADKAQVLYNGMLSCADNPKEILECIGRFGYEECVKCSLK